MASKALRLNGQGFPLARQSLPVDRIVLRPVTAGNQKHYVGEGDWNLVGKYEGRYGAALRNLEMVAGDRNVLTIPSIPFSFEISRPDAA